MADIMQYEPQIVEEVGNIIPLNSPFYQRLQYTTAPFTHIRVKIWYWTGGLLYPYEDEVAPNIILYKEKINPTDNAILFEIADYVKGGFSPEFAYTTSGDGTSDNVVFFKYEYDIINNPLNLSNITPLYTGTSNTFLGTQGWNWNWEANNNYNYNPLGMSFGFQETVLPTKKYGVSMRFLKPYLDLGQEISDYVLSYGPYTPPTNQLVCAKEPWLIVYLNKDGFWDYFTPTGKVSISNQFKKEKYTKALSRPDLFNNRTDHLIVQYNNEVGTEITVNTGLLKEKEGQYIEEILYSPKVYLIEFKKTLTSGLYNNFLQRAVIVEDSDFGRKTRLNDKNKISYNIKFKETTNKIRNVR